MRILTRSILREIFSSALLGTLLFTFVLFLQRAGRSFELLARSASGLDRIGYLILLIMPFPLTFALPVGALVGILIGLSRMSSDGEITGMRAAGVPGRSVLRPVMCVAVVFTLLTAACSMWLTPLSIRETTRVINELNAEQITAQVQPRVFQEQFPGTTLYIADIIPGPVERWRNVFIADDRAPGSRSGGVQRETEGPAITLAEEAIAIPDLKNNRIQLHLRDASTYEAGRNPAEYYISTSPVSDQALQAERPGEVRTSRPFTEMDMGPLWHAAAESRDAAIELHQRLALPFACILLALVGVPLGVWSRKSGRSAAFVVTVALAFFYYMGLISLISLARQGAVPVWLAVWTPNTIFAVIGLVMMIRLEVPGDRDIIAIVKARLESVVHRLRGLAPNGRPQARSNGLRPRLPVL
ncbi:MAG: LptF/LptG family permease, partial [bacterium]